MTVAPGRSRTGRSVCRAGTGLDPVTKRADGMMLGGAASGMRYKVTQVVSSCDRVPVVRSARGVAAVTARVGGCA